MSTAMTRTVDPATGEEIATHPQTSPAEVDAALSRCAGAQREWRRAGFEVRGRGLISLADALRARREEAAALLTAEMGKPRAQALAEVDKCVWVCEHYAEHGAAMLAPEAVRTEAADVQAVTYVWLGVAHNASAKQSEAIACRLGDAMHVSQRTKTDDKFAWSNAVGTAREGNLALGTLRCSASALGTSHRHESADELHLLLDGSVSHRTVSGRMSTARCRRPRTPQAGSASV